MPPSLFAILLLALCSLPFALSAQYFTLGTDPASVRWHQIKTEHFKVIYPGSMDAKAMVVANSLEYFRIPGSASSGKTPDKWPVILHNMSVVSNAYTPYAPKRIEMITTPPQDNEDTYGQDWLDQLIIHEFRHTTQYTAINTGLTRGLSYIFGQQIVAGVLGVFVPFWFIEGDAVVTETANSHTGRGRVPAYEMKLRAQFLEKGIYSYDKAYNGSFRDFTPNWYELGYLMVGQTRLEFGRDTWSKVIKKTGSLPVMLVPFSNKLYRETGFGKSRLYRHITSGLAEKWKSEDGELDISPFTPLQDKLDRFYSRRTRPAVIADGSVIAVRTSIDDVPRIIMIDSNGIEKILVTPGFIIDENLSASGQLICWTEKMTDPRWDLCNYSVIKVFDIQTGRERQISHKTRYFSPKLSNDGKLIAAIEVDDNNGYFLVIMDVEKGTIISRFSTPGNYYPDHPAWSNDDRQIAVILTKKEGKCLALINAESGKSEIVLSPSYVEISKPCFYGDYILMCGSFTGIDNIFAFNTITKQLFQVTSSRFGATDPAVSPDGKKIYYDDYNSNGYRIVSIDAEPGAWTAWDPAKAHTFELADQLAAQENFVFNPEDVPDSAYTIKPYHKGLNLFNIHSWAPLAVDIGNADAKPGISLLSQNLLGTSFTTLGYAYDLNEETGKYFLKYSYTGLYPAFDLDMDYGLRRGSLNDSTHGQVNYSYDELNIGGWVRVPLQWTDRSWFLGAQPYLGYSYKLLTMNPGVDVKFGQDRYNSLNSRAYFYAQSRMSERDLHPRWAQMLDINYRQTLGEGAAYSSIFSTELDLCFPGLWRHHNFIFYGGFQERLIDEYHYTYSDQILIPRGFSNINTDRMLNGLISYDFPIFCPDWNIGPIIYLKRLNASLFYNYAVNTGDDHHSEYISTGMDLTVDFHLFRLFAPLEAGLRTIYFPQSNTVGFEFLYSVNLSY